MSTINEFNDRVWDRFLDFIFPDSTHLTRQEVQADLRHAGIDMRQPASRLHALIKQSRAAQDAKGALDSARKSRLSILTKLMAIQAPSAAAIREKLIDVISRKLSGPQQAVYARKLESAASDEDLQSLLEDLSRLEAFMEGSDDGAK